MAKQLTVKPVDAAKVREALYHWQGYVQSALWELYINTHTMEVELHRKGLGHLIDMRQLGEVVRGLDAATCAMAGFTVKALDLPDPIALTSPT